MSLEAGGSVEEEDWRNLQPRKHCYDMEDHLVKSHSAKFFMFLLLFISIRVCVFKMSLI